MLKTIKTEFLTLLESNNLLDSLIEYLFRAKLQK